MTSAFDPQAFLDATLTEPSIKLPPLPVGDYVAVVGEVTSRAWTGKNDPTQSGIALDVPLSLEIPAELQSELGYPSIYPMKDSIMLNLTEAGSIDMAPGKNRSLRSYREALDMNKVGDSFSPRAMQGKVVTVKIKHDIWEGEPINRIAGVARRA